MASEIAEEEKHTEEEAATPEKKGKKRSSPEQEDGEETGKGRRRRTSPATEGTPMERPSRERKTVERYSAASPKRTSASKSISIKEGSGTKLKDIPNIVFKLSKRKVDDNLQALHTILFGRKANVHNLKRNIFQFSGFVWPENEEKLRARLKERLDKYNKDKLVDFCELLDIHILKASTKKEELTIKLVEFLESPHITRDVLLADKDMKRKKRTRKTKGVTSSDRETKKQIKSSESEIKKRRGIPPKDEKQQEEDEDGSTDTKGTSSDEEGGGDSEEEREQANSEDEDEKDEAEKPVNSNIEHSEEAERSTEPKIEETTSPVNRGSPEKSVKSPTRPASKKALVPSEDEPEVDIESKQGTSKEKTRKVSKASAREKDASAKKENKKKSQRKGSAVDVSDTDPSAASKSVKKDKKKALSTEKPAAEEKKARKKKESNSRSRVSIKEQGKAKSDSGPSTEELRSVLSNILKEVDFNTATLADILKQLGARFKMDLMSRKAEVKQIIEDVINSMTDDEDGDDDDDEDGEGNDNGDDDNIADNKEEENQEEVDSDGDGDGDGDADD